MGEILKSIIFGILEGICEWLPISSTGHIILLGEFIFPNTAPELGEEFAGAYRSMFDFVIQLGAIMAVLLLFFPKLNIFSEKKRKDTAILYLKLFVGSVPAALMLAVGNALSEKLLGNDIEGVFYNSFTVGIMLILYGVLFIAVERASKKVGERCGAGKEIGMKEAFFIGCFQGLSIIPGTSRSGATMLGARLLGVDRERSAEFSFLLAVPAICGASLLGGMKFFSFVAENGVEVPPLAYISLATAAVTAFVVSLLVIKILLSFVRKHTFVPFGVYRIILGAIVICV